MLFSTEMKYIDIFLNGKADNSITNDEAISGLNRIDEYLVMNVLDDHKTMLLDYYGIRLFATWFVDMYSNKQEIYKAFRRSIICGVADGIYSTTELERCESIKKQLPKEQLKIIERMVSQHKYLFGSCKYIQALFSTGEFFELKGRFMDPYYMRNMFYLLFFYGGNVLYFRNVGKNYVGGYRVCKNTVKPLGKNEINAVFDNIPVRNIPDEKNEGKLFYEILPSVNYPDLQLTPKRSELEKAPVD